MEILVAKHLASLTTPTPSVSLDFFSFGMGMLSYNVLFSAVSNFCFALGFPMTSPGNDSTADALQVILKILGTLTRDICDGRSFQCTCILDTSNCLKQTLPRTFFWELFEKYKTSVFSNIP